MSTLDEIAATLILIYQRFVKIGYMDDDCINWAPHTLHPLDVELCHSVGLDDSAIDFIQKMLWCMTRPCQWVLWEATGVDWSAEWSIRASRDPTNADVPTPEEIMLRRPVDAWIVPLAYGSIDPGGRTLVIDCKTGFLYVLGEDICSAGHEVESDNTGDYLDSPPRDAVEYLKEIYRKLVELENIPDVDGYEFINDQSGLPKMKRALFEDYGWPENFRREDWRAGLKGLKSNWRSELQEGSTRADPNPAQGSLDGLSLQSSEMQA